MRNMQVVKIRKVQDIMHILLDLKAIHNLSYRDLEEELEIGRSTLQRYAEGKITDINYENMNKIIDYINKITGQKIALNTVTTAVAEERIILNELTSLMRRNKANRKRLRKVIELLKIEGE